MPLIINGQVIQEQILRDELLRVSGSFEMNSLRTGVVDTEHLRSVVLSNVVTRMLLCQAAIAEGLRVTDAEMEAERIRSWGGRNNTVCSAGVREAIVEDLLVQRISAVITRHVQRPGRAETREFYMQNHHLYRLPEAMHVAHIVRNIASADEEPDAQQLLQQAEAELARGRAFAQVADRYSDCKGVGGSIGWILRGQMVPEFEEAVLGLPVGHYSSIFRTVFGLHIATVLKKRAESCQPFEEVRSEVASRIFAARRQDVLAQAVSAMERASQIHFTGDPENV